MSGDVWYLDTSAFVKLIRREAESEALVQWLSSRRRVSSDLLRTESRRVVSSEPGTTRHLCERMLDGLTLLRITPSMFDRAGQLLPDATVRSLDALHLVAAESLASDLAGIVAYDQRLLAAAARLDMATVAPA